MKPASSRVIFGGDPAIMEKKAVKASRLLRLKSPGAALCPRWPVCRNAGRSCEFRPAGAGAEETQRGACPYS